MDKMKFSPPLSATSTSAGVCDSYATFDYQVPSVIISIICAITGIIYCFFGYRFFKAVLFLSGFLFGSALIYLVCDREQFLPTLGNAGVAVGAGVLFGLITMLVQYVGLFMSGFLTGLLVGVVIMLTWSSISTVSPSSLWITIGVLFGAGLLFALVSLKWQRLMIISNTSLTGGALLVIALDYFADHMAILQRIWEALNVHSPRWTTVCWYAWMILATWPTFIIIGSLVQWRLTSVGYNHKEGWRQFRRRRRTVETGTNTNRYCISSDDCPRAIVTNGRGTYVAANNISGDPTFTATNVVGASKPHVHRSWRSIYQSRRMHGDIICQKYLESLQRLSSQQGQTVLPKLESLTADTPTLSSDHTRLTVLTNESNKSGQSAAGDSNKSS